MNIEKEVSIWSKSAKVLPFTALSIICTNYYIGNESISAIIINLIIVSFVTISVIWWWWALYKILDFVKRTEKTAEKIDSIQYELKKIKDASNR